MIEDLTEQYNKNILKSKKNILLLEHNIEYRDKTILQLKKMVKKRDDNVLEMNEMHQNSMQKSKDNSVL